MILFKLIATAWVLFLAMGVFFQNVVPNSRADKFISRYAITLGVATGLSVVYWIWSC